MAYGINCQKSATIGGLFFVAKYYKKGHKFLKNIASVKIITNCYILLLQHDTQLGKRLREAIICRKRE